MCGCGKRGVTPRFAGVRPSVGPKAAPLTNAAPPAQVRALGLQKSVSLNESRKMDEKLQLAARARRDAINRRRGK